MRNKLLTSLLLLATFEITAQYTTFSPWTAQGIGDRTLSDHGIFTGIGNCRISYYDSTVLNIYNPSTYGQLSKGMPLYSIGLNSRYTQFNDGQQKSWNFSFLPDHLAMGFGFKRNIGLAFGLKPFTKLGYEVTERTKVGTDSIKYIYKGKGGGQEVFLGLSTDLINFKSVRLSIGGNAGYIFGNAHRERQSILINANSTIGGVDWSDTKLSAVHYELASNLNINFGKSNSLHLTTVYEPYQELRALDTYYLFYGNTEDPELLDTLSATKDVATRIYLAEKIQIGGAWKIKFNDARKDNSLRKSELAIHVNYTKSVQIRDTSITHVLNQTNGWNVGLQYTPECGFQESTNHLKFIEKLHYRVGYYQLNLAATALESMISDKGFTLGFGLPITSFRTLSSLNFSLMAGERSNFSQATYNERYLGFNFGITLAPSNFDKWFVKRKLD